MSVEADDLWQSFLEARPERFVLEEERAAVEQASQENPLRPGVDHSTTVIAGLDAVTARPTSGGRTDLKILWFHGGAFTVMRASAFRAVAGHLAGEVGCEVIVPDYPLAPESKYPTALNRLADCYSELVDRSNGGHVALLGDSAGAALAIGLQKRLRNERLPQPFLTVLQCPWVDLTLTNPSLRDNAERDAVLGAAPLELHVESYLGDTTPNDDPEASPFHGDLAGLGSIYIQSAEFDVLVDDAIRFTRVARAAGVDVELEITAEMPHAYQFFAGVIPEADMATTRVASRIVDRLDSLAAHRLEAADDDGR